MKYKPCNKCQKRKELSDFYKDPHNSKGGFGNICKECAKTAARKRYSENPEPQKVNAAQWKKCHPAEVKAWRTKRRLEHPEIVLKREKGWRSKNIELVRAYNRKYCAKARGTAKGRLTRNIGKSVWASLRGLKENRHWEHLVGYTIDQLKKCLEKQFLSGMAWDNYGEWHVDHKIPISAFNFETSEDLDFKRCWSLKNLQPLWAVDNMKKRAKLYKPFQPSLTIQERGYFKVMP